MSGSGSKKVRDPYADEALRIKDIFMCNPDPVPLLKTIRIQTDGGPDQKQWNTKSLGRSRKEK